MILDTRDSIILPINQGGFQVGDEVTLQLIQLATGEAPLNQNTLAAIILTVDYSNDRYTRCVSEPIQDLSNKAAEGIYRWSVLDGSTIIDRGILKLINNTDVAFNDIKRYQSETTNDTGLTTVFYSETL